jgi:hypothetical protein
MTALVLRLVAALSIVAGLSAAAAAQSPQTTVDLQLVLAVDASGSVNQYRFELQRDGYVAAFRHPQVISAITSGPNGAIAVTVMQWTGPMQQVQVVPWTRLGGAAAADAFAAAIAEAPRRLFGGGTSVSGAIDTGVTLIAQSPFRGLRRVIDVSGDGANNRGRPAAEARDEAVAAGIVVNGLPIVAIEPDLDRYYEMNVIGGPGSFMIAAASYEHFADAVRRKLILEIAATEEAGRLAFTTQPSAAGNAGAAHTLGP